MLVSEGSYLSICACSRLLTKWSCMHELQEEWYSVSVTKICFGLKS